MTAGEKHMLVSKCNSSRVYYDFRTPNPNTTSGLGKKLIELFLFLSVIRMIVDAPRAQAGVINSTDPESDWEFGSGESLDRACRQIISRRPKSFFAAVKRSKIVTTETTRPPDGPSFTTEPQTSTAVSTTAQHSSGSMKPTSQIVVSENSTEQPRFTQISNFTDSPKFEEIPVLLNTTQKAPRQILPKLAKSPICRVMVDTEG